MFAPNSRGSQRRCCSLHLSPPPPLEADGDDDALPLRPRPPHRHCRNGQHHPPRHQPPQQLVASPLLPQHSQPPATRNSTNFRRIIHPIIINFVVLISLSIQNSHRHSRCRLRHGLHGGSSIQTLPARIEMHSYEYINSSHSFCLLAPPRPCHYSKHLPHREPSLNDHNNCRYGPSVSAKSSRGAAPSLVVAAESSCPPPHCPLPPWRLVDRPATSRYVEEKKFDRPPSRGGWSGLPVFEECCGCWGGPDGNGD